MTSDPPDPIAAAAARYKRDNNKALASRRELTSLVLDALRDPEAKPIDIAKRAEWTPAYVRKLARDNDIQADADYKARTEKARARLLAAASLEAAAKPKQSRPAIAAPRQQVTQPIPEPEPIDLSGISPEVADLSLPRVRQLAASAEARTPEWVAEIREEYPDANELRLCYLIVDTGFRQGRKPPELAEQPTPDAATPERPAFSEETSA